MKYIVVVFISLFVFSFSQTQSTLEGEIIFNPNKTTPLSAIYRLNVPYFRKITVIIKGKSSQMDIQHTFPAYYGTDLPIYGLYPNMTNTVIIKSKNLELTNYISTPKTEFVSGVVTLDTLPTPDPENQDFYFVNHLLRNLPEEQRNVLIAYDRMGDIRYINYNHKLHYLFYTNQQILIKNNNGIYDLLNNRIIDYKAQSNIHTHHDSLVINNNHIVLANSKWGVEDRVVELDNEGKILRDLSFGILFRDIITNSTEIGIMNKIIYDQKNIYQKNGTQKPIDWAHANSLVYDESKGILYFSLRHQGVIAVDYQNWKLLWWMADDTLDTIHEGVPNRGMNILDLPFLAPYRVKGDALKDGPKNQHALLLFKNGNIGMFDNSGDDIEKNKGSRYVEYKIRGRFGSWTADKVREYKDDTLYSDITSDVDLVGKNRNILLLAWGTPEVLREIDKKGIIIFEMKVKQEWFLYRVDKMPFYPYQNKRKKYAIDANLKNKFSY